MNNNFFLLLRLTTKKLSYLNFINLRNDLVKYDNNKNLLELDLCSPVVTSEKKNLNWKNFNLYWKVGSKLLLPKHYYLFNFKIYRNVAFARKFNFQFGFSQQSSIFQLFNTKQVTENLYNYLIFLGYASSSITLFGSSNLNNIIVNFNKLIFHYFLLNKKNNDLVVNYDYDHYINKNAPLFVIYSSPELFKKNRYYHQTRRSLSTGLVLVNDKLRSNIFDYPVCSMDSSNAQEYWFLSYILKFYFIGRSRRLRQKRKILTEKYIYYTIIKNLIEI
jgi:hypothetical protein